eukprot:TRINITY_DN24284_c0_g1_i1.p1 TRINITY_DN24284_c0_g1~~TRINITY_DN24284_c0_g1_i1.p1  ORF type:complete len:780 (+),score=113.97 TRINITY_DN24284_c0_g1_i1:18-2357(+)
MPPAGEAADECRPSHVAAREDASSLNPPAEALRSKPATPCPPSGPSALLRSLAAKPVRSAPREPQKDVSGYQDQEESVQALNLDSGESRPCSPTGLTASFVGVPVDPLQLAVSATVPWKTWWSEKRWKDAQLLCAAAAGDLASLVALLQEPRNGEPPVGVNTRLTDAEGHCGHAALHLAAGSGELGVVEALLAAGAQANLCTMGAESKRLTPLHVASSRGHLVVISTLLDARSDPFALTSDRNLPLHLAASCGQGDAVSLLLDRGGVGQLSVRNELGQRPCQAALDISTALVFRKLRDQDNQSHCRPSISSQSTNASSVCSSRSESAGCAETENTEDCYAGRTPLLEAGVLLRNARTDAVQRLLHGTRQKHIDHNAEAGESDRRMTCSQEQFSMPCRTHGAASPQAATPVSPASVSSTPKVRAPFARVRHGSSKVEKVGPSSFELVKLLGRGSFGEVFQVKHKQTHKAFAMKVLQKSRIISSNLLRYAMTERNILAYVRHPYIVSLHYAFQTSKHLVLVLQYCPGGNLQHLITREKRLYEPQARLYAAEILLALMHLHERHTIFRDLKPDNVVMDEANHAMLTDFGLSKEGVGIRGTRSFCGSVAFLAPEILLRKGHGHTVDIYNLGVLLFAMLTGLPPFYTQDRETLFANIRHARLDVPGYVSFSARTFIEVTMERDPTRRLGAARTADVQEHIFFCGINFAAVMRREVAVPQFSRNRHENNPPWKCRRDGRAPESPFACAKRAPRWQARRAQSVDPHAADDSAGVLGWEFSFAPPRT